MAFACLTPPADGGVTATADSRAVLRDLPEDLVARFERHGWRLTRHDNPFVGIGWQEAFGTDDPSEVDRDRAEHGIEARWDAEGALHTVQTRPAVVRYPETGERCWFNQIAFLNEWTMLRRSASSSRRSSAPRGCPSTRSAATGTPLDLGERRPDQRRVREAHRSRAVAPRRPPRDRQRPHRAQP
ncbi:hypothetical protein SVIOM342S_03561 [Streptomyces violaceorubidus]